MPASYARPTANRRAEPPPGRVPIEFVGLARRLRTRIAAVYPAAEEHREKLVAPFRPRPGWTPMPRHDAMKRLANRLRAPAVLCRLRAVARFDSGELKVVELWVVPARLENEAWTGDEPAVALLLRQVTIRPPAFVESNRRIAGIGLHALARRYQRGADRQDRAVLADLLPLAEGYHEAALRGGEFEIPVPAGRWIGAVAPGTAVAIVRTYLEGTN